MEWEALATIVALVGVFITFVFNIRSNALTRKWLEQERDLAREAMEQDRELHEAATARSEAAARLTEGYTRRVVDALERMAVGGSTGEGPARPAQVRWKLEHEAGDRYRLTNIGHLAAREVDIDTDETLPLLDVEGGPDLRPDEAMTFIAAPSMATRDRTVVVSWTPDGGGEPGDWRYPLPARPARN